MKFPQLSNDRNNDVILCDDEKVYSIRTILLNVVNKKRIHIIYIEK
jgi:hypothetical protein